MEFSTICIVLLGIITVFLLGTVFFLWLRVKNLRHYCMAIDLRIDSVRLNYLIGFRNLLIQQEKFEDVEYIDEVTVEDMLDLL